MSKRRALPFNSVYKESKDSSITDNIDVSGMKLDGDEKKETENLLRIKRKPIKMLYK